MDVYSLHKITAGEQIALPFSIKDYQRYVFGDDRLAHRFGTELAKAFIASPGFGAVVAAVSNQGAKDNIAVAVLTDYVPTATHGLRNHFVAYLNRHLLSLNQQPALKIDVQHNNRHGPPPQQNNSTVYHVDRDRVAGRPLLVLGDMRIATNQESSIKQLFTDSKLDNRIIFLYIAELEDVKLAPSSLTPSLAWIANPSVKDVETFAQAATFCMNEVFVKFVLGQEHEVFCQLIRRQDDSFARLLLDYAIGGSYYKDDMYQQNVKFLLWEVGSRDSV